MRQGILFFASLLWLQAMAIDNIVFIPHDEPVVIYESAFGHKAKRTIQQVEALNLVYSMKVLDDSVFRFKLHLFEPGDNIPEEVETEGWIEKINAAVFVGCKLQDDGRMYMKLFDKPDETAGYKEVFNDDHYLYTAYVDAIDDDWYHVNFVDDDNRFFSGWVNSYCVNPYGGCN